MSEQADSRLIVLQRNALTGRALARCLAPLFTETQVTTCPRETEALLNAAGAPPTDLVCGQRFADDEPSGVAWIARWRGMTASLRRVVLVTAEPPVAPVAGLDAVFDKPVAPATLQRFFAEGVSAEDLSDVPVATPMPTRRASHDLA